MMQDTIVDCGRLADMDLWNLTILILLLNVDLIISQNNCCTDLTQQCQTECTQQINCCNQCKTDCTTCCCSSPCATSTNRNCLESSCTDCKSKCSTITDDCRASQCVAPSPDPVLVASSPASAPVIDNSSTIIHNNNTMVASINITNSVTVENHINVPIEFNNENKNDVHIVFSEALEEKPSEIIEPSEPSTTPLPVPTERIPSPNPTTCNTTVERVPVFIPIPAPSPAAEAAAPTGCCSVLLPCVSQSCPGFRNICSERCSHRYMYAPVDPCAGGCYRRDYAFGTYCNSNDRCRFGLKDCSRCDRGFYMEYRSYRQCSGCFYV